jgi:hypothetical protein
MRLIKLNFKFQAKASPIPRDYPQWCSWYSQEMHLPEEFHSPDSFSNILKMLRLTLKDPSVLKGKTIDAPLLLFGLTFREVSRAIEAEPGDSVPSYLEDSCLGIKEFDDLTKLLKEISALFNK